MSAKNVEVLGQVFTPPAVVEAMIRLRKLAGRVLEPSCGDGAFVNCIPGAVGVELDATHAPADALVMDFFAYPEIEKFDTVIGNPPYVRHQDIGSDTKALLDMTLFDQRSNLYVFFIEKAIRHLNPGGELIFITPRDFMKATGAAKLNRWLALEGSITHAIDLGDSKVFAAAVPNCLIWRFEKACSDRIMRYAEIGTKDDLGLMLANPQWQLRRFVESDGQLMFSRQKHALRLKDIADVRVGAASGADDIFADPIHGNADFVCSETAKTGALRRMILTREGDPAPAVLLEHKERLISRKIRRFGEDNWWLWGRNQPAGAGPRVYVNGRTRQKAPFFLHDCPNFDGSVFGVFPKAGVDIASFRDALNAVAWDDLGFVCDGRFIFNQRSLENALLPESFRRFLPRKPNLVRLARELKKLQSEVQEEAGKDRPRHPQPAPDRKSPYLEQSPS